MKIGGMMVVGPNEPYLDGVLEQFKRLRLDHVIIVGNNTDAHSESLIRSFGYKFYRDDREWGRYQPDIKSDLLKRFRAYEPDWIVACDSDEFYDEAVTRETLEELALKGGIAWNFYVVNYWDDEAHYAHGLSFWNVRFFKFTPEYGLDFLKKPVHCGLAPPMQYRFANDSPYILWHYGLMDKEKRMRKVERYKKYDPNAVYKSDIYYQALADQTPPAVLDKEQMRRKVREDVKDRRMKTNFVQPEPEGFVVLEKDGRRIDVAAKDAHRYERQGWKKVTIIENIEPPSMYAEADVQPPESDSLICPICGFRSKSKAGAAAHIRAQHKD